MKLMVELRAAFDGYSGIPQETRLLFRGLAELEGIEVIGLLQSSNLVAEPGLPVRDGRVLEGISEAARIDRLSKVVVSLQQGAASHRLEYLRKVLLKLFGPVKAAVWSVCGRPVPLGGFDAFHFRDFIWRALFAKSLPEQDFECVTSRVYRVLRWPWSILHQLGVLTAMVGRAVYARLDTRGIDVMVVETPFPGRVSRGTQLVVRYHDAIPLLMPHTIKARGYHRAAHFNALSRNARDGAWFACVSEATRRDLLAVMPQLTERAVTIPNMVGHHFFDEPSLPSRVPEVIWSRKSRGAPHGGGAPIDQRDLRDEALDYLLIVGTIEPRKNHSTLLDAWERLRAAGFGQLNLVVVGALGWEHSAILDRFTRWLERGGVHFLEDVPANDLRMLYRHAAATVCPSYGEGFDFPGIEAMRCGGVVVASDIPVHRDVFGGACEYFSPYSPAELADRIGAVIGPGREPRRQALVVEGAAVAAQYLPERVLPQWRAFLQRLG